MMYRGEEERAESGIVSIRNGIGAIAGPISPSDFSVKQDGVVNMTVRIKNVGNVAVVPYWWLRVHESATLGTGSIVKEWSGQMNNINPAWTSGITVNFTDDGPLSGRDVFLKLAPQADMSQPSYSGGEDHWSDAYSVTAKDLAGVSILDLTLS